MLALEKFLIPGTIVVCGDRKSCLKIHCKTMHSIFAASSEKERLNFLPFHWPHLRAHTMLQHSLHCMLGSGFASCSSYQIWLVTQYNTWIADLSTSRIFPRIGAWTNVIFCLLYQILFGVEFQVYWLWNISLPILQFLCLLDLYTRNKSAEFVKCPSIN